MLQVSFRRKDFSFPTVGIEHVPGHVKHLWHIHMHTAVDVCDHMCIWLAATFHSVHQSCLSRSKQEGWISFCLPEKVSRTLSLTHTHTSIHHFRHANQAQFEMCGKQGIPKTNTKKRGFRDQFQPCWMMEREDDEYKVSKRHIGKEKSLLFTIPGCLSNLHVSLVYIQTIDTNTIDPLQMTRIELQISSLASANDCLNTQLTQHPPLNGFVPFAATSHFASESQCVVCAFVTAAQHESEVKVVQAASWRLEG